MISETTHPYFQRVYRRTGRYPGFGERSMVRPSLPHRRRTDRYNTYQSAHIEAPETPSTGAPLAQTAPISLSEEFARLRAAQTKVQKPTRLAKLAAHPIRSAIAAVLLLCLTGVVAVAAPIVYNTYRAYDEIFVDPAAGPDGPNIVSELNDEGTAVIVTVTPTPQGEDAALPEWNGTDRITVLLLGVDQREGEVSRSDTMILVNVNPVDKTARMLSIPRDLKVIIPGYGAHKINAAFAFGEADKLPGGGAGLMMRTIEANFGINVDYFASVNFEGFVDIVDIVGGVTLDVPYPIRDDAYPGPGNQYMRIRFESGWQHMDGERVLQYARTRHDDGDGRRAVRQQQVLLALRQQALNGDLLRDAPQLITELGNTVRTDLDSGQVLQLARLASEIDSQSITQMSINDALWVYEDPEFYFLADWDAVGLIMSDFAGEQIVPPMSALANPRYDVPIQIYDGVINPGLGYRVADVLIANGFTNVTVIELDTAGNYPTSSITVGDADITTAYLVAGLIGVDLGAITVQTGPTPTPIADTPTATPAASVSPAASPQASPMASPVAGTPESRRIEPLFPTASSESEDGTGVSADTTADDSATGSSASPLIIVLGDDAPDPAYYTADPLQ